MPRGRKPNVKKQYSKDDLPRQINVVVTLTGLKCKVNREYFLENQDKLEIVED